MEKYFQVGVITSSHGLRGEVKVYPTTDDARRFRRLKEVIICRETGPDGAHLVPSGEAQTLEVEDVKFSGQTVILKFKGIDSIEQAQQYRRASLMVPRENAVRLSRDEYYVADLIGLSVLNEDGQEIGLLKDVMQTGANDVYVIGLSTGKEILLPAIRQCVLEVDVEAGFVKVHILEGLEEL